MNARTLVNNMKKEFMSSCNMLKNTLSLWTRRIGVLMFVVWIRYVRIWAKCIITYWSSI